LSIAIEERVREEVEALHEFFVRWFSGAVAEETFESGFLSRFSTDLVFIPPAGRLLGLEDLAPSVRAAHASNANFRVAIRRVRVQRELEGHVLATNEEGQRNALASTPADNGRLASVLFTRTEPLQWLHIHETWLPEDVMSAGPYDF
jgi:hypothetical protein